MTDNDYVRMQASLRIGRERFNDLALPAAVSQGPWTASTLFDLRPNEEKADITFVAGGLRRQMSKIFSHYAGVQGYV